MKILRIYSFWIVVFLCTTTLTGCKKSKFGDIRVLPEYIRIRVVSEKIDRDLNKDEISKLRLIVLGSSLGKDEFYRISDIQLLCYKAGNDKVCDPMSMYISEGKIYLGYWIDARTAYMTDRPVECLNISRDDALWLRNLQK